MIDHPSQLQHDCMVLDAMQYDIFYEQALSSIDLEFIHAVFNESAHKDRVDTNLFDFERFAAEALTIWENLKSYRNGKGIDDGPALKRDFRRIFPSETVSEDIFILEAREKVKTFETTHDMLIFERLISQTAEFAEKIKTSPKYKCVTDTLWIDIRNF